LNVFLFPRGDEADLRLFRSAAAGAFCGRAWRLWKYIAPACRALLSPALRRNLAFRFSEKDTALWDYPQGGAYYTYDGGGNFYGGIVVYSSEDCKNFF